MATIHPMRYAYNIAIQVLACISTGIILKFFAAIVLEAVAHAVTSMHVRAVCHLLCRFQVHVSCLANRYFIGRQ